MAIDMGRMKAAMHLLVVAMAAVLLAWMMLTAFGCATRTYSYERTTTHPDTGVVESVALSANIENSDVRVGKMTATIPGDPPVVWEISDLDAQERLSETLGRMADTLDKTLDKVP